MKEPLARLLIGRGVPSFQPVASSVRIGNIGTQQGIDAYRRAGNLGADDRMPFEHLVDAEDFDQTGRNLEEEVDIVANILAQSDLKELRKSILSGPGSGTASHCVSVGWGRSLLIAQSKLTWPRGLHGKRSF